jgi:aminoglycoside phosphotransferase (APT) family kinase protein
MVARSLEVRGSIRVFEEACMSDDLEQLRSRVRAHLASQVQGAVELRAFDRLPGGACQDNFKVDLTLPAGDRRVVLRCDAPSSLPGSINRQAEYRVINAAADVGVKTPRAAWPAQGLVREGSHSYFLDWVEGEAVGRRVVSNPKLEAARQKLPQELAEQLARIHSITPKSHPDLFEGVDGSKIDPVIETLRALRGSLDSLLEPRPALELAMRWLTDHPPTDRSTTLVHGDFRTGNFMVSPRGLEAVLDWEFSRWSSPGEDLGWICVRDWRFGRLDLPVGGFSKREPFYEAYEKASGRTLNRHDLLFWEVVGNVRWASGSIHQGERYLSGAQDDIELIAIARRASEMEFEALRLIERGE